jgi:hypothetical protein
MPDGHGPAMRPVTAVDDQFGTHTLLSVVLGAILGFFPAYLLEIKRERNRLTTRWDEPLYETCNEFAAAARKSVAVMYRTKGNTELEATLDQYHDQMRALTEQLYLLGTLKCSRAPD